MKHNEPDFICKQGMGCYRIMLLYCFGIFLFIRVVRNEESRTQILTRLLSNDRYDSEIVPDFELNVPTNITVHLLIQSIHSLSESTMRIGTLEGKPSSLYSPGACFIKGRTTFMIDFSVDLFLRQRWRDRRLAENNMTSSWLELDNKMMDKVWTPDTFFPNEKEAFVHDVTAINKLMHLYKNGTIIYSQRLSLKLTCSMRLQKYPFDRQTCPIFIETYAYTTSNIVFLWRNNNPVEISPDVELPQFEPPGPGAKTGNCNKKYSETGNFSCIYVELVFTRQTDYFIVQVYIPSVLIVALSWVSFWVDIDAVPARVSLGIMTVLTMTTQSSGARQSLPAVSYIKAIDVWMSMCLIFVFTSLLEYAYVNVLARKSFFMFTPAPSINGNSQQIQAIRDKSIRTRRSTSQGTEASLKHSCITARRVDKISRVAFPLMFIAFNVGFWVYYLSIPDPPNHVSHSNGDSVQ